MSGSFSRGWLCVAALVAVLTTGALADVLLEVDLSVPNQVTINATSGLSAVDASDSAAIGLYFENFYGGSGSPLANDLVSGNLTNAENISNGMPALWRGGSGSDPGLNVWGWSDEFPITFTAGSLAFTGTATWNLTPALYAEMLAGNSSGNLLFPADTYDDGGEILGTYIVTVPEPAVLSLLGLGLGLGMLRVRKRR